MSYGGALPKEQETPPMHFTWIERLMSLFLGVPLPTKRTPARDRLR